MGILYAIGRWGCHAHSDADCDAHPNPHRNADADRDSNRYRHTNRYGHQNHDSYQDSNAQAHGEADSYADCYRKFHLQQDAYRNSDQEGTSVALPSAARARRGDAAAAWAGRPASNRRPSYFPGIVSVDQSRSAGRRN